MLIPSTVKRAEEKAKEERRIRKEIELKQMEEQRKAEEEQRARERADAEAVERWKAREAEKEREKEEADREHRRRMKEHLLASGVPEDQIQAILEKKKISQSQAAAAEAAVPASPGMEVAAPPSKTTYTRMARRHLSLETLRIKGIDFDLDTVSRAPLSPATTT
jgi:hypothetical protein